MGHEIILTFAGGLGAAVILGYLAQRVGISPIVGYLLAGIVVGPQTPGFVASSVVAEQFAEIGIVLLMFGVGLRFHLHELIAVWKVAVPGALLQSAASTAMTAIFLHLMGMAWPSAIVIGMAVSVASTVVLVRVLSDHHDLHARTGHIAVGWVVVEDLLTIALLVVLPLMAGPSGTPTGGESPNATWAMIIALIKLVACVGLVVVGGQKAIPWLLERIAITHSRELFTLAVLAIALGIAVAAAQGFGVSMALGAFLAGFVVGRSEFAARAAGDALPMRDAFAVLFFVSVGLLFDPRHLIAEPLLIALVLAIVVIGKPLAAIAVVRASGRPWSMALPIGAVLGQIGEFTFILGTAARGLGLIDVRAWNTLIAVAMISIALNPSLYRMCRRLGRQPDAHPVPLPEESVQNDRHCIVIGHGPVGQHVVEVLAMRGVPVTIVEMNLATVRSLRKAGQQAIYGDAARLDTLSDAGLDQADSLVISSDVTDPAEIVRLALARRPGLRIMVRCTRLNQVEAIKKAGAKIVIAGEGEIAITLTEAVLRSTDADAATLASVRDGIRASFAIHA